MRRLDAQLSLLDSALGQSIPSPLDAALADRLERRLRAVEPDALFERRLRGAILNRYVAAREGLVAPPRRRREMGALGRGVLYASLGLALSVGAAGTAAAESLPGDLLYPVKLELEELRMQIAPPALRADLLAMALEERLDELQRLAAAGLWGEVAVAADAVAKAEERLAAAGSGLGVVAAGLFGAHTEVLEAIVLRAPASAQDGLQRAIDAAASQQGPATPAEQGRETHAPSPPADGETVGAGGAGSPEPTGQGQQQQPDKAPKPES